MEFSKTEHDFGTINEGDVVEHEFTFTNTGKAPLVVTNAKGSCGCTVPKKPEGPIAPGETGEIQVKYDTNRVNPIRKTMVCQKEWDVS